MFGRHKTDVLVAGGGPVGLFTAAVLADRGVDVEIVDKSWRTAARSYALALHPASLRLFDEIELLDDVLARGWRIDTIGLYDGHEKRAELSLHQCCDRYGYVVVLPQSDLEDLLVQHLTRKKVKISWNHRVSGIATERDFTVTTVEQLEKVSGGYAVTVSEWEIVRSHTIRAAYVIGADGHRSIVRREIGSDFPAIAPSEFYAVIEFDTLDPSGRELAIVKDDDTLGAFWPLGETRARWSFELENSGSPGTRFKSRLALNIGEQTFPHLDESHLARLVAKRAPWFKTRVREVDWCTGVQFEKRLAGSFGGGRLWLAGDSAHMTGPIGIQSMNLGLLEGYDLANRVAAIVVDGASPNELSGYSRASRERWSWLFSGVNSLQPEEGTDPWISAWRDRLVGCLPASGEELSQLSAQVGLAVTCRSKG